MRLKHLHTYSEVIHSHVGREIPPAPSCPLPPLPPPAPQMSVMHAVIWSTTLARLRIPMFLCQGTFFRECRVPPERSPKWSPAGGAVCGVLAACHRYRAFITLCCCFVHRPAMINGTNVKPGRAIQGLLLLLLLFLLCFMPCILEFFLIKACSFGGFLMKRHCFRI